MASNNLDILLLFRLVCLTLLAWQVYAVINCNKALGGRHADPDDVTCKNYTLCVNIGNNQYQPYYYVCPTPTLFNPYSGRCSSSYICNSTISTDGSCTYPGRYPIVEDKLCKSYYICMQTPNGNLTRYNYTCPASSVFHPTAKLCTTSYRCP